MPEIQFTIRLPDGTTKQCYSPSTVVRDYFHSGDEMSVADFQTRARQALTAASERVRAKFGFACSSAQAQMTEIEEWTRAYAAEGVVQIVSI